jgi:hypothetical protein
MCQQIIKRRLNLLSEEVKAFNVIEDCRAKEANISHLPVPQAQFEIRSYLLVDSCQGSLSYNVCIA